MKKNIAIIEDDIELKEMLEKFINFHEDYNCLLSAESIEDFLKNSIDVDPPDVIISDIGLPGINGIEGLPLIKERFPDAEIIMLTVHDDSEKVFASLCRGASGYLLKNTPLHKIKGAIDIVLTGGSPMTPSIARRVVEYFNPVKKGKNSNLTDREHDIVEGLVEGLSYKLIADRYNIAIDTVRQHIRNIYRKLNVNCKAEVISKSFRGEI